MPKIDTIGVVNATDRSFSVYHSNQKKIKCTEAIRRGPGRFELTFEAVDNTSDVLVGWKTMILSSQGISEQGINNAVIYLRSVDTPTPSKAKFIIEALHITERGEIPINTSFNFVIVSEGEGESGFNLLGKDL
jgi:hypothetical protein